MKILFNGRITRMLFVGLLTIGFSTNAHAIHHGICGDSIEWTLTDGILTFYGSGQMQDFDGFRPWSESKIKSVVIKKGITNIGKRVFEDCRNLKQITIPSTVTTIGDSAFYRCYKLKKINMPNSVVEMGDACFWGCSNLNSIVLSDNLQNIGQLAFYGCRSLTDIIIPNSVKQVGSNSFLECTELTVLIVPDDPFEVVNDTTLGLEGCDKISIVRAHHSLCPDYIQKYIPANCPFMIEGNPRRYYGGTITRNSVVVVPAIKEYTLQEAIDTTDYIFQKHFSISTPCNTYYPTQEQLSRFINLLEFPMYKDLLQHYYDLFYEAGSQNNIDGATLNAFKHLLLGGTTDVELMWDIIITKYGTENETNNTRFLMNRFNELSVMKDSAYQHTVDSLTNLYYDVLYPSSLREMCGYWVSVNDTTPEGNLTESPEYIINIEDVTCPSGTTILSSPKCDWSSKKKKDQWKNKTYDDTELRYSYETGYNQETQTLQLLFSTQSKKIANAKLQHEALDIMQNFEATMKASLEQFQNELNRGLAYNRINFSTWGANTAIGLGIGLGVQVVTAVAIFAVLYASNIETAENYEILLTPQAPDVLDVRVRYAYARHNYNNGKTKNKEDIAKFTFIKWEETDNIVFVSDKGKPIFIGNELPINSPLLEEYNAAKKNKAAYQQINKTSIEKLRQKAEGMMQVRERKEATEMEENSEKEEKVLYY